MKKNNLVPLDCEGEKLPMCNADIKAVMEVAGRRTHRFGLYTAVGDITLKDALQAAYVQGMYDTLQINEL